MQLAAAELRFETAAKIKLLIDQLSRLGKGPNRHVGLLRDFRYLSLQHGPREGTVKVFLVTPGWVEDIAGLVSDPTRPGELLRLALEASERRGGDVDPSGAERIGIVAHHLFSAKHRGVFLRLETVDEKAIARGCRDLRKQAPQETAEGDGEGVMKELQSL